MSEGHMFNLTLENARIAVIGLGYVGLPLAVEFGKSRPVLGFDINAARVAALEAGHDATLEVEDRELKEATHLRFSGNAADLASCNTFIVTVPTPIDARAVVRDVRAGLDSCGQAHRSM